MEEEWLDNELINRFEEMLEEDEHYYFDTDQFYEIISYYLDVGDLQYVYKAIKHALELHPDSMEIKIKVLEYYLEVDLLHSAYELIKTLKVPAKNELDFIIAQARYWSLKSQHTRAIHFYKQALEFDVEQDYIYHCLGTEYKDLGEVGQALKNYKRALELDLDDDLAFYSCLQCFEDMHKPNDAIKFIKKYIEKQPYSEVAWFQLGLIYKKSKDYTNALESFEFAVCVNTKSISSLYQVAGCYEKLENYDAAIETYKEAILYDDSAAYSHLKIAHCYLKQKNVSKALNALHQSIHEDPQLDKAWADTSAIYESLDRYEESIHYLKRAVDLDINNLDYLKRLAFLSINAGYYEEAELSYEKIVEKEPNHFLNWFGYTELLILLGEYPKAIKVAQRGLKRFERAELYYQVSCCEYLLNRNTKGFASLYRAKLLNPKLWDDMQKKYPILKLRNPLPNTSNSGSLELD